MTGEPPWKGATRLDTGKYECSFADCEAITNKRLWSGTEWLPACEEHDAQVSMKIRLSD
jgi:hypothetical protein